MVGRVLQTGAALRILTYEDEGRILISTVSGEIWRYQRIWRFLGVHTLPAEGSTEDRWLSSSL